VRLRLVALALLGAAAAVHFGVTVPTWARAASSQDAYRRARDVRRGLAQRLAAAERRADAQKKLAEVLQSATQGPGDDVARLRRDAIAAARAAGVGDVRLEVTPGRTPVAASLRLAAGGALSEVTLLTSDLPARRAVVLDSVRLLPRDTGGLGVELSGVRPGGGGA
jgi:hypothetical protein